MNSEHLLRTTVTYLEMITARNNGLDVDDEDYDPKLRCLIDEGYFPVFYYQIVEYLKGLPNES